MLNADVLMKIRIRQATINDIDRLMPLYAAAKAYMNRSGNPNQWIDGYPSRALIAGDIEKGHTHIIESDGIPEAVFSYIPGEDPTYAQIDGHWLDDAPYAVVHRLASAGRLKGVGKICLDWSLSQCPNLRVDTHADNLTMQHILESYGFVRCGIIHTHNGTPRIAYQIRRKHL